MLKTAMKDWLLSRGMVLSRPPGQFDVYDYKLRAARERGLKLDCVLDGGAADGQWTRMTKQVYPDATIIAVEPREDASLRNAQRSLSKVFIEQCLLGPADGEATFNEHGPQSSMLPSSTGEDFGKKRTMPVSTLDSIIERTRLPWPDLIKLDLQGYELEALKGGARCLDHAQAVLLEVSFIPLQKGAPVAHEAIAFMHERSFRVYDVTAMWHRPLDGALAQGDFLFLKNSHPLLADNRWAADSSFS